MPGVLWLQTESGQGVRHNVRSGRQVFTGSSCEVHDALDAVEHFPRFPPCHSHIVEGIGSLGCGELGLCTHLPGFLTELVELFARCAGDSLHLAHRLVKVCRGLDGRSSQGHNRRSHIPGHGRAHGGHLVPDALQLLPDRIYLIQGCVCLCRFTGEVLQLLFRFNNLPLQGIVLVFTKVAAFHLLLCLFLGLLQRVQLFLGSPDLILQERLFLGEKLCMGWIELQKPLDVFELRLGRLDGRVTGFQSFLQACDITIDLDCDPLNSGSCHMSCLLSDFV